MAKLIRNPAPASLYTDESPTFYKMILGLLIWLSCQIKQQTCPLSGWLVWAEIVI